MQPLKVILHHDLAADNAVGHCRKSLLPVPDPDGRREAAAAMLARAVHQPLNLALGEIASFNCQSNWVQGIQKTL